MSPQSPQIPGAAPEPGAPQAPSQPQRPRGAAEQYPPLPEPLPVAVYDNHTHLELGDEHASLDPSASLDAAQSVGVKGIVQVGTDLPTSVWSARLAASDSRVLAAVALHPNEAPRLEARGELDDALEQIAALAAQPRVRAIGETGLDFFRTGEDGREAQHRSFEAHIAIAKQHDLALQIHDRDAHEQLVRTLRRVGAPERTVLHCFSGDEELARICADEGWFLSIAGTVTFKNAPNVRRALAVAPRELLLVETDAPYLTPAPYRGRPNAPYLIPHTLRAMAAELGADPAELGAQIAANTERAYGRWDA